jgi:hypothetical protein
MAPRASARGGIGGSGGSLEAGTRKGNALKLAHAAPSVNESVESSDARCASLLPVTVVARQPTQLRPATISSSCSSARNRPLRSVARCVPRSARG